MSHFRDRVILSGNIPQLPSGVRAIASVPILRTSVATATLVVSIHAITPPTITLDMQVPAQTAGATSP